MGWHMFPRLYPLLGMVLQWWRGYLCCIGNRQLNRSAPLLACGKLWAGVPMEKPHGGFQGGIGASTSCGTPVCASPPKGAWCMWCTFATMCKKR